MKRFVAVLGLTSVVVLPGASAGAVVPGPSPQPAGAVIEPYDGPGVLISPEEALIRQAEELRLEYPQYSLGEAKNVITNTIDFAVVASKIRDEYPDEYSYSRSVYEATGFKGEIHVKGKGSKKLKSLATSLSLPVDVVEDAPLTKTETREITATVIDDLTNKSGIGDVEVSPSVDTGSVDILIGVEPGSDKSAATKSKNESKTRVEKKLKDKGYETVGLNYTVDPEFNHEPTVLSGGTSFSDAQATSSNPNPRLVCTSAFTAIQRSTGLGGLLTADHCNSSLWYEGRANMALPSAADPSVTTDARFVYNRGEGIRPYFIFDRSDTGVIQTTTVRGIAEFGVDTVISTYGGKTADRRRSRINKHDVDVYYKKINKTYYNLTRTDSDVVTEGDSGGPWYVGNTATGITSGRKEGVLFDGTYYAPIDDATRRTNTRVNLAP